MASLLGQALFTSAFETQIAEMQAESDVPIERWSKAGKGTKAYPNGEDLAWWREQGPDMIDRWIAWRESSPWSIWVLPDGNPCIEAEIRTPINDDVDIKMFIDRVFVNSAGELIVLDLKTGKRTPESDLQLGVYAHGIQAQYGVRPKWGCYWMARKGEITDLVSLDRYTPGMINAWMNRYLTAVDAGLFIPNLSNMCRACGLRDYCAAYGGGKASNDPDYNL